MSNSSNSEKGCQGVLGVYSGFDGEKIFSGSIRCKKWSCPYCGPRNRKKLYKRLMEGPMAKAGIGRYALKMVTLTFGGNLKREKYKVWNSGLGEFFTQFGTNKPLYDAALMYDEMSKSFNLLLNALRSRFGKFHYFRICELHRDGVPHFHILFAGKNIVPKSFYKVIEKLWKKYGLGFVKVNVIRNKKGVIIRKFNDVRHAVNYLLKYLTKNIQTAGKWKRVFTSSRGSLLRIEKKEWEIMEVIMGHFNDNGEIVESVLFNHEQVALMHSKVDLTGFSSDFDLIIPDIVQHTIRRHQQTLTLTGEK